MSKIIRACGAVFMMVGGLMCYYANDKFYEDGKAKIFLSTIGEGDGSKHKVCGKEDDNIEKFSSVNFQEKDSSNLNYHFFHIDNPKEYMTAGKDAHIIEKGPYMLKKFSIKYNIGFKSSTLSNNANANNEGSIEYDVANAYITLDKNTDVTTTLGRNENDLSLVWDDSKRKSLSGFEKAMPDHLSMSDKITNLSPIYLSALGQVNDEFSMVLSLSCTQAQITNIPSASSKSQCNSTQINDMNEKDCTCCMLGDEFLARGNPVEYKSCETFFDDAGHVMSSLSLLAYYDGGIAVKKDGESKYDNSGDVFNETHFKQKSFYSALIQTHSVNELMFGYSSAFIGNIIPRLYMGHVKKKIEESGSGNLSTSQVAAQILTGKQDNNIPFKLGNVAEYTKHVGSVCFSTCKAVSSTDPLANNPLGWMCDGNAPQRHKLKTIDKIVLGEINCKPFSSTFATKIMCNKIEKVLQADPSASGYKKCSCADDSDHWKDTGCCLASGKYDDLDLTAAGCLYPVKGLVDKNYVGMDADSTSGKPKVDVGQAIKGWVSKEVSSTRTQFMCPNKGIKLEEHEDFGHFETYNGKSEHVTFYSTGMPRIRQGDVNNNISEAYTPSIKSASSEFISARGLNSQFSETALSNGHIDKGYINVFLKEIKSYVVFKEDRSISGKICGTDLCLKLARLYTSTGTFIGSSTKYQKQGYGLPYNGLIAIGHSDGPSENGRPAYVSQSLYFNSDEKIYTQQNSSHTEGPIGNGIKIFRPKDTLSDPGIFVADSSDTKYVVVDKNWVNKNKDILQSYFDVEPATGTGIRIKQRFGLSYSVWECDPVKNDDCSLLRLSNGIGKCYGDASKIILDRMNSSVKDKLTAAKQTDFNFSCSAANILSPRLIGGKIIPMYWYEDARTYVDKEDIDSITSLSKEWFNLATKFAWLWLIGWKLLFFAGLPMILRIWFCSPPKEFLIRGSIQTARISGAASSTAFSSAASTAEENPTTKE